MMGCIQPFSFLVNHFMLCMLLAIRAISFTCLRQFHFELKNRTPFIKVTLNKATFIYQIYLTKPMRNLKKKVVTILIVLYLLIVALQSYIIFSATGMAIAGQQQQGTVSLTLLTPLVFEGSLDSNGYVFINWTPMITATHYNIYYSENISAIMSLDLANIPADVYNFSNITDLNYTDSTAAAQKRYYTLSYATSSYEELSTDTPIGRFTYYYDVFNSTTYGPLSSNRINLFLDVNYTAESFLQEIPGGLNPTISRLEKSDGSGESLITHVRGLSDGNDFQMYVSQGYLITLDQNYNHTLVGKVDAQPYILEYDVLNSTTYGPLASNWKGTWDFKKNYTAEIFLQEIPGGLNPTISKLVKSDGSGESLITHVRGLADGNDFQMYPGVGYTITIDANHTHTLCTNCFS